MLVFLMILFVSTQSFASENIDIPSVFPDRSKPPGLLAPDKCWWAKEITPDIHISGRLTEKQIKHAKEAGFKSIVSLFTFTEDSKDKFGDDALPTTEEAKKMVESNGMKFVSVLPGRFEDWQWASVDAVRKLTQALSSLPRPALLHCQVGYTISFVTLLYLANQTRFDPTFTPRIASRTFFDITAAMGLDYSEAFLSTIVMRNYSNYARSPLGLKNFAKIPHMVVAEVTGEPLIENPPKPNAQPDVWIYYWVAHPVFKNYYVAGQITKSHIPVMQYFGFSAVINLRSNQKTTDKKQKTTIKPDRNYDEFLIEDGYLESLESQAFDSSHLAYYHLPIDGSYGEFLEGHLKDVLEVGRRGPLLIHSFTGKSAADVAVLAAALQHDKDLWWALQRLRELGFDITKHESSDIFHWYEYWLVSGRNVREDL